MSKEIARRLGNIEQEVMKTYAHLYEEESKLADKYINEIAI